MTDYLTRVAEAVRKLRYYGEVTPSCDDNPTRKLMREAADLLAAAPEAPEHDRPAQWWLAELDQYGNPTLIDGAHGQRAGADQAFYLHSALGLAGSRKYAVARVELSEPVANGSNVNHDAVGTLRMAIQHNATLREQNAALVAAVEATLFHVNNNTATINSSAVCELYDALAIAEGGAA